MSTKVKGDKIKEGSIPLSALDDKLKNEINCKYGLSGVVCILNSNNTTSDIFTIENYFVYVSSKNTIIKLSIGGETELSQLGGPSAIITTEVIGGYQVKFSVSGSISYYGDLIIGNKYNEVPTPTPDWNAPEGEAGYIENKPFDVERIDDVHFGDDDWWVSNNAYIFVEKHSYNDIFINNEGYYPFNEGISHTFTIDDYSKITVENLEGFPTIIYQDCFETKEQAAEYLNNVLKIHYINALDDIFLPNTIVKATPQKLSTYNKNQALANLGIDPVVWKYICNPYILKHNGTLPAELLSEDGNSFKYTNKGMYLIHVNSDIDEKDWDITGEINTYIPVNWVIDDRTVLYGDLSYTDVKGTMVTATVYVTCPNGNIVIKSFQN